MMIKVMSGVSQVADLDKIKTEILTNRINNDRMDIGPVVKIKEMSLKNFCKSHRELDHNYYLVLKVHND